MTTFVDTWKGIAALVGRSDRWCQHMAAAAVDPLPVFKVGGIMRLRVVDLDAWVERRRRGFAKRRNVTQKRATLRRNTKRR